MNPWIRPSRRDVLVGMAALGAAARAAGAPPEHVVTPEMFGAKGDGRTNDTQAFAALSSHVNARGGGTIVLRPVTYIVGAQHPSAGGRAPSFAPADIIHLIHCTRPIVISGNGATLRCAPGLRYGRFDPQSGQPLPRPPRRDLTNQAVPYAAMIFIQHCSASVDVSDLELDGNLQALWIGGPYGGGGWQAGATGIHLGLNSGPERLSRIHSHHHGQDGLILNPTSDRAGSTEVTDVVCDYNGRQGCSITSGRNFVFQRCKFNHTGRAVLHSNPGDGVDIEAETGPVRNVMFEHCEFSDNTGFGLGVGRQTNSSDVTVKNCKFVGTTNFALWPDRPGIRFSNCVVVGSITSVHGDPDPARATQFHDCIFTDNPALSPTRQVFLGRGRHRAIAELPKSQNLLFDRCHFRLTGEATLPLTNPSVTYSDCDMSQRSAGLSKPTGTYVGTNTITGNASLEGSVIRGKVLLNGRLLPRS